MILRFIMFGVNIRDVESIIWLAAAIAYCVLSYKYDSYSNIIRHSTSAFLGLSVLVIVAMAFIDRNPQPKMHAFEGAARDSVKPEEIIEEEQIPELPVVMDIDTIKVSDSIPPIVEDDNTESVILPPEEEIIESPSENTEQPQGE